MTLLDLLNASLREINSDRYKKTLPKLESEKVLSVLPKGWENPPVKKEYFEKPFKTIKKSAVGKKQRKKRNSKTEKKSCYRYVWWDAYNARWRGLVVRDDVRVYASSKDSDRITAMILNSRCKARDIEPPNPSCGFIEDLPPHERKRIKRKRKNNNNNSSAKPAAKAKSEPFILKQVKAEPFIFRPVKSEPFTFQPFDLEMIELLDQPLVEIHNFTFSKQILYDSGLGPVYYRSPVISPLCYE